MMQGWSQEDYDERKQRQNDGVASDTDRRLIKQYEQAGFRQTRLMEQDEALARAEAAKAKAGTPVGEETTPARPSPTDNKPEWVAWAEYVNTQLSEELRPVDNPADPKVTKEQLVAYYKDAFSTEV